MPNRVKRFAEIYETSVDFFSLAALPPPPYGRLSYVVFVVGTNIEDCIRGAQNVAGVLKKDRGCLLMLIEAGGGGRKN